MSISKITLDQLLAVKDYQQARRLLVSQNGDMELKNNDYIAFFELLHGDTPGDKYICFTLLGYSTSLNFFYRKKDLDYVTIENIIKNAIECDLRCYISMAAFDFVNDKIYRRENHATSSSVLFVDCDIYNDALFGSLPPEDALAYIAYHKGWYGCPTPSYAYYTGRGLNLVYRLDMPMDLKDKQIKNLRKKILDKLIKKLDKIHADAACTDIVRVTRMCSSINYESGHSASKLYFDGEGDVYSLEQLTQLLDIKLRAPRVGTESDDNKHPQTQGYQQNVKKQASQQSPEKILSDLERLSQLRKGHVVGSNNNFVFHYACMARWAGMTREETLQRVKQLAVGMKSNKNSNGLEKKISESVDSAYDRKYHCRMSTIITKLAITEEEREQMVALTGRAPRKNENQSAKRKCERQTRKVVETDNKMAQIKKLLSQGIPVCKIAEQLHIRKKTVSDIKKSLVSACN